jgi:protein tyrosine/serine phosphatase
MQGHATRNRTGLRLKQTCLAIALCCFLVGGGYAGWLIATNNFHVVIPNELYRSAQPSSAEIAEYKAKYGIRTIVNLRGANPKKDWYQNEIAASESQGITHIDFGMSSQQIQPPEKIERLITVLAEAPKPILIHCESGADRSGLVAAVYLAAIAKKGEETAEAQLSIRYGHFSIPVLSQAYPMDQSFDNIEGMFGYAGTTWDLLMKHFS